MAQNRTVKIATCPSCAGKNSESCQLCWGIGKLPKDRCGCGRPAIMLNADKGETFCGFFACLGKPKHNPQRLLDVARVGDRKSYQEEIDDAEEQAYAEFGMGVYMGHGGHGHHSKWKN